jgi:hypothetical protein
MGKSKKAWKHIEDEQRDEQLLDSDQASSVKTIANSSLFFVDAKGQLGGMEDLKRRKKRPLETVQAVSPSPSAKDQKMSSSSTSATVVAVESVPTKMDISRPSSSKYKRRHTSGLRVVTKAAHVTDDKERRRNLALAGMTFDANLIITDIWAEDQNPEKGVILEKARNKGFEVDITPLQNRKRVYLRPRTKKQVEMSKELVDTSGVQVCPAGASFNPDEAERQKALEPAYLRDEKERTEAAELKAKLNPDPKIVENAFPEEDDESELFPSKKQAKPKTKAQKNAKLRLIQEAFDKAKDKKQVTINKQIDRLGSVLSEVKNNEKKLKVRKENLDKLKEDPDRRPKTSKHEFEAPFPEVPLEHELTNDRSMRTMTPSVLLMRDQFKRFQEKNIIEPRVRVTGLRRRYRMKAYTRKSHKDPNDTFPCKASKT